MGLRRTLMMMKLARLLSEQSVLLLIVLAAGVAVSAVFLWWDTLAVDNLVPNSGYERVLADGRKKIQPVREFQQIFPQGVHTITYFTGEIGDPNWNAKVGLYGRYVLTMKIPLTLSPIWRHIVSHGEPAFYLTEVDHIEQHGLSVVTYYGRLQLSFRTDEWKRVVNSNGDIRVLHSEIRVDQPVDGFVKAWR